jgi:ribonucleoside-diphosphate reductase beta chain
VRVPLMRLMAGFCVAERAVSEHLAPFEASSSHDPELRACFAAQADDERRHARFFDRVAGEVMGMDPEVDARLMAGDGVIELFENTLPDKARDLAEGRCELGDAVVLYHLVLEGVVFSVGQTAVLDLLERVPTLPVTRAGMERVQADERWHVGLGVRCLQDTGVREQDLEATLKAAGQATRAWQTDSVGPEHAARAVEQHRRRLAQARQQISPAA